jgi:hypothetical protein
MHVLHEGGAVKAWQNEVDVCKGQVNKLVDETQHWEGVIDGSGAEAKRVAFPLLTPVSRTNKGR